MCRKFLVCCLVSLLLVSGAYADVALTPENFPDDVFREKMSFWDDDSNSILDDSEIEKITSIWLNSIGIYSLKGIEYFSHLRELSCWGNNLTELDLSGLSELESVSCSENQLTVIELEGCTALKTLTFRENQLTGLKLEDCPSLEKLDCFKNQFTEINAKLLPNLKYLDCGENDLTSLNVTGLYALETLECSGNSSLYELSLGFLPKLRVLSCSSCALTHINVSGLPSLVTFWCHFNYITVLNLANNPNLTMNNSFPTGYPTHIDCTAISGQTTYGLTAQKDGATFRVDLTPYVGTENLANIGENYITMQGTNYDMGDIGAEGSYDPATGIATATFDVPEGTDIELFRVTYGYHTHSPNEDLIMRVNIETGGTVPDINFDENDEGATDFNGHTYKLFTESLTWQEAKEKCEAMGGHLATITTPEEDEFIAGLLSPYITQRGGGCWLGAYGSAYSSWQWVTSENMTFTAWMSGQPDYNERGHEFYGLHIWYGKRGWADYGSGLYTQGFICEWGVDSPVEDAELKVDVLESTNSRGISNIIRDIASLSYGGYLNADGKSLTESELSTFPAQTYSKKGFTADGNTRLILRAQSNKPGLIRFSMPASLDARLENLSRDHWASPFIDIPTTEIASNTHQASAVLIAPETYPLELDFPSANFRLRTFLIGDEGETQSNDLYLTVEAAPVILIHGLESNSTSAFRIGGSQGIHHRLTQDGFYVDYWDYDGTKGPEDIFREPNSGLFMKIIDVFDVYKAKKIACTRVDIVAHSMGGLMARRFLETEDCYSARSYMQGMVRRIVTVATPHEGSPIANYFMKDYSVLHNSDLYESYILSYMQILRGVIKNSYESALNFGKSADSAFRDLSINSPLTKRLKGTPPAVPLFSLYGECKTAFNEYIDILMQYLLSIGYDATNVVLLRLKSLPKIVDCIFKALLLANDNYSKVVALDDIKTVFRILYGDDDYDLMVGATSALSIFDGASLSHQGLDYHHTSICGQEDIGAFVSNLLKGSKDKFSDTRNYSASSTKSIVSSSENEPVDSPEEIAYDDLFSEHYVISSSVKSITVPASATLTISSTKEFAYPIYISLKDDEGCKLAAISADGQTSAQITLEFSSQDTGIIEVSCFSGSDEGVVYVSNNLKIAVLPELDDVEGLGFLHDNMTIHVNKGSEIPVNVFARKNDGTLFDVASPLTGTLWTVEDPLIAEVTDDGNVLGLSEGTTMLTASYKGFTASVSVDVGAAIVTQTESEDITSPDIESPDIESPDIDSPDIIAPAITTASLVSGQADSSYSAQLQASGTEPITWTLVSGDLPTGLTLNTSGLISGTPSSSGTFTFTAAASNNAGQDTMTLTLTVNPQETPTPSPAPSRTTPSISTSSLPEGSTGTYYSAAISASGSRPITFTLTAGNLPDGLNFTNGSITGTPEKSGSFSFTVRAANSAGSVQRQFTLTVKGSSSEVDYEDISAPSITASIPTGTVSRYYVAYISVSGTKPVNVAITAGNLPDGLNFSGGMISGIPAEAGTFTFTITASNRGGQTESDFTLTVNDASVEKDDDDQDGQDEQIGQEINSETAAPDIVVGRSRSISSLNLSAITTLSNDTSIIAAVLPEIRCNKSGVYTFSKVQIYPDVPAGSVLVWNAFASGSSDYDNSYADFLDVYSSAISQVPDDHRINIAAYLEEGKIYAPVITAIVPSSNNHDNTSESGGGGGGGGCNSALSGIIFAVFLARKLIME